MVDKPHTFDAKLEQIRLQKHVYDLVRVQNLSVKDVMQKTGLSKVTIYRYLRTFVDENPKVAEQMRKSGTAITPEDYKKLQEENARLHSELKREKLRADFYEEMVAFGKEVYGIDLKKASTK